MTAPAPAEQGFSKGALCNLNVWASLGTADGYSIVSVRAQAEANDAGRLLIGLFTAFRGNVTGAYYGPPRARRWDMFLDLGAFPDKPGNGKEVRVRAALGA